VPSLDFTERARFHDPSSFSLPPHQRFPGFPRRDAIPALDSTAQIRFRSPSVLLYIRLRAVDGGERAAFGGGVGDGQEGDEGRGGEGGGAARAGVRHPHP
jgi:hypothetical protein